MGWGGVGLGWQNSDALGATTRPPRAGRAPILVDGFIGLQPRVGVAAGALFPAQALHPVPVQVLRVVVQRDGGPVGEGAKPGSAHRASSNNRLLTQHVEMRRQSGKSERNRRAVRRGRCARTAHRSTAWQPHHAEKYVSRCAAPAAARLLLQACRAIVACADDGQD